MAEIGPEIAEQLAAACRQGAAAAAEALASAFAEEFSLAAPEGLLLDAAMPDPAWSGPGLIFTGVLAGGHVAMLLPNGEGLIPAWCAEPTDADKDRLRALAQSLAAALLPAELAPGDFDATWANDLATAAAEQTQNGAGVISLAVSAGSRKGDLSLLWAPATPDPSDAATSESIPEPPRAAPKERVVYERIEEAIPYLPVYSRSLLKIKAPVRVTLASTRLPLRKILELAPGTLIQFPKLCDEPLDLEVGQRPVARGEAVKIGEKFGLRITSMILPGERFVTLAPKKP